MPLVPTRAHRVAIVLGCALLAGCTQSAPAESVGPSAAPSDGSAATEVCDASAAPSLVGPDGTQVVLGDGPAGTATFQTPDEDVAYLRQVGACVWIIGFVDLGEGEPPFLTAFHGRLGSDFRIVGTFADINGVLIPGWDTGAAVFVVRVEDGDVILVADRTSTGPPGCFGGDGPCPEPLELRRSEP